MRRTVQELESALRAKDEFLSLISHELRSPLNAMVGWLHILRSGRADADLSERALAGLGSAVERQRRLVDQLLDATRIVSGQIKLEFVEVDVNALLCRVASRFGDQAAAQSIALDWAAANPGLAVLADPVRVEETLATLLDNAIQHTPMAGRVALGARSSGDESVEITVADSGAGFAADDLARLFSTVGTINQPPVRQHGGLGLGLAIAKALSELQGGVLQAKSDGAGRGSTFIIRLRQAIGVAEPLNAQHSAWQGDGEPGPFAGASILVVDDRADPREVTRSLFGGFGARVTVAHSAQEASDLYPGWAQGGGERLVLSELAMPREDGLALIRRIRALEAERNLPRVPAVGWSAQHDLYPRQSVIAAGFDLLLQKPLSSDALRLALAPLLGVR